MGPSDRLRNTSIARGEVPGVIVHTDNEHTPRYKVAVTTMETHPRPRRPRPRGPEPSHGNQKGPASAAPVSSPNTYGAA